MDSPNQWNEKGWGKSQHLYICQNTDLALALGRAGGASSLHVHRDKHNIFVVQFGVIELWGPGEKFIAQVAGPGDAHIVSRMSEHPYVQTAYMVPAGVPHRMVFLTDARLHELYQAVLGRMLDLDDIERLEPGWKPGEREVITRQEADSSGNPLSRGCECERGSVA